MLNAEIVQFNLNLLNYNNIVYKYCKRMKHLTIFKDKETIGLLGIIIKIWDNKH